MEIEWRDREEEIPRGVFLKEVNQVSLFFPFFFTVFKLSLRRADLFFLLRAKRTALITEFYIVPCVESLSSWKILNLGDT